MSDAATSQNCHEKSLGIFYMIETLLWSFRNFCYYQEQLCTAINRCAEKRGATVLLGDLSWLSHEQRWGWAVPLPAERKDFCIFQGQNSPSSGCRCGQCSTYRIWYTFFKCQRCREKGSTFTVISDFGVHGNQGIMGKIWVGMDL